MYGNLRKFLHRLSQENELVVVEKEVDPCLEIAEIHRRVIEEQGPALLFTNVKGSPFPVVTNLFGTPKRVDLAFGNRPEYLVKRMLNLLETLIPPTMPGIWKEKDLFWNLMKMGTCKVTEKKAPILYASTERNPLRELPALTSWPEDGGPFLTLPLVYTENPGARHEHNLGMYRIQIHDCNTTGVHWQIHKGGGFHYSEAERRKESLPVSIFLGGPPALIASAIAPIPENVPELLLASFILGEKLPMVEDPLGFHMMPAEADFVIKGIVPPYERRLEGPFGDHYGYYSLQHEFPVIHVSHMWHRKGAIYPATIVGKPRQEDYYLGEFLQRLLSPAFPVVMPGIRSLWTYAETGFHALASAVVRESYSREALTSAFRILGEGQLTLTKCLLVTDQIIDLENFPLLLETILERMDPKTDLFIFNKTAHDTLDYTGDKLNHGSKAVMIGVGKPKRQLPVEFEGELLPEIMDQKVYCKGCMVISGKSYPQDPHLADRLVKDLSQKQIDWPLIIIVDEVDAIRDQTSFLWTVFTRFNPASDIYCTAELKNHHLSYRFPIVIDARMKPGYPEELECNPEIRRLVDQNWDSYQIRSNPLSS